MTKEYRPARVEQEEPRTLDNVKKKSIAPKKRNSKLLLSAKLKFDEFYTFYKDIEEELQYYKQHLAGKVVYSNADNPEFSNFVKYFVKNFKDLNLKKYIATYYSDNPVKLEITGGV